MFYIYLKGVCSMNFLKKSLSTILCCALTVNTLGLSSIIANATESNSKEYVYDGYKINYDVTNSWGNTEVVSVTLSNTGDSTIENWMLYFDPNGQVHDTVNIQEAQTSDGITYFRNSGYNANVNPNSSVSFSYMIDDCEAMPDDFTLCQTRANKESGYQVSLQVNQTWGDSFNGNIIIQNDTDKSIEAWELTVDTNFTITEITNSWAATVTELEPYKYMLKGTYTSVIPAGGSVSLGFNGVKDGEPVISDYSLDDVVVDEEIVYNASSIKDYTIPELEELNKDNFYPLEVKKNEAGNVISIDGKFSHVLVTDEKSALKALCSVKTLLGIADPKNELVLDYIYKSSSADYVSYFFKQIYKGTVVYGRTVTVVARNNGETISLDSNYLEVKNLNNNVNCSLEEAKIAADANEAELVVYNFDEYENFPVMAYLCKTDFGAKIISAQNSEIISDSINVAPNEVSPSESVYNPGKSEVTDSEGNLIYYQGKFGEVETKNDGSVSLALTSDEKDKLKTNDNNVTYVYANKSEDYFFQLVPDSEYEEFINSHKVITGLRDLSSNDRDADGNRYVDVAIDIYNFDEYYKNLKVYGRVLSLTVNDENNVIIADSNLLSNEKLETVEIPEIMSISEVVLSNSKLSDMEAEINEPVIYSWDEYYDNPVVVYVFLDRNNNRTYLVDADTGEILNEDDDNYQLGKGLDEGADNNVGRRLQYFPIASDGTMSVCMPNVKDGVTYNNTIDVYDKTLGSSVKLKSENTYFYEPTAISTYLNVLKAYDYYASKPINHMSYSNNNDNKESHMSISIKSPSWVGAAGSAGGSNISLYRKNYSRLGYGTNLATLGHEYTHCVFHFCGNKSSKYYTSSAINESYANLFGALISGFDKYKFDISQKFKIDFESNKLQYLIDSGYTSEWGHSLSDYISYPAYIMYKNELPLDKVSLLYYTSLNMGRYNNSSNMNSVRINVVKAAKALRFTDDEMKIVTDAYNEIWGKDNREYTLTLNVQDYTNSDIELKNVSITLKNDNGTISLENKKAKVVEPGWYTINIKADGYVSYNYRFYMGAENSNRYMNLVKNVPGNGQLIIKVVDFVDWQPVDETVKLYTLDENLNETLVGEYKTGADVGTDLGTTESISLPPGYYLPKVENGYHYFLTPIAVVSGETSSEEVATYYDLNLNPNEKTDIFYFGVNIYKETPTADQLDFYNLYSREGKYKDSNGNVIAKVGKDNAPFGCTLYFYCYERENETFDLGFNIDSNNAEILNKIKEEELLLGNGFEGKLYNLEITFSNDQDKDYKHTMVLTANDLKEGFNKFATISYDNETQQYVTMPAY